MTCTGDPATHHIAAPTIAGECQWLLNNLTWIAEQPWLDEIHDDVTKMLTDITAVTGDIEPVAKLLCTNCGWPVNEQSDGAWYSCSGCGRAWSRLELHRMAERKKPKTLTELVPLTGLALVTLKRYRAERKLKPVGAHGNAEVFDLDEVMRATEDARYRTQPSRNGNGRYEKAAG